MVELEVGEFIRLYCDSISTKFDGKVLPLSGFYQCVGTKSYSGVYYDALFSKDTGLKLTLLLSEEQREQLTDGKNYTFKGYVNRSKKFDKNSNIGLHFKTLEIVGENKEVQLVKQEEYDLLKRRFELGLTDVKQLILDCLDREGKCKVVIITGSQSIVDQDFEAQFSATEKYEIELLRTSLSNADQIVSFIQINSFDQYDLIAFMRGGDSGLEVFDSDKLCQKVLDLKKLFITALGHHDDLVMLSKFADKNLSTPSALGTYLQNITDEFDKRTSQLDGLKAELDQSYAQKEKELEVATRDIRNQLSIRTSQLKAQRLWIAALVVTILGLGYLIYDQLLSSAM